MDILGPLADLAMSQSASYWLNLGLNIIVSTIVGGIVLAILLGIVSREWGEPVKLQNTFLLVLLINIVNLVGVLGFLHFIPFAVYILPPLIWIVLVKAFFGEMSALHTVIIGIVGWTLSILLIPSLVVVVMGYIPI